MYSFCGSWFFGSSRWGEYEFFDIGRATGKWGRENNDADCEVGVCVRGHCRAAVSGRAREGEGHVTKQGLKEVSPSKQREQGAPAIIDSSQPEANLNPSMFETLVKVLLNLQRDGVQIFIATHSYVLLKEFDVQKKSNDAVKFFSLMPDEETSHITVTGGNDYLSIMPNPITDAYSRLYDEEIKRSLGRS